jgi:hypothetical protein
MGQINLSNAQGRDALVSTVSVRPVMKVRYIDESGRQVTSKRLARATLDRDYPALLARFGSPEALSAALVDEDPEIDLEFYGSTLSGTKRVYLNEDNKLVHHVLQQEVVLLPDGSEKERRPLQTPDANVATEVPLRWTGKLFPKQEVYNKFVFSGLLQVTHVNGLTYDFLYGMAKELAEKQSLLLVGSGPKGTQPLVFMRGGTPFRGFLEGRIDGDRYALLLHLSNMELKAPKEGEA